ncbi:MULTISPECIES: MalY/PatB family protein [unclassified Paenibacillus]|uniref:MalY/PatB family protein n=1 Tax=unclassified Paenibacillus TaxID=185978 RepID=UPI000CFBD0C0|nr:MULTISPECIES: PatB family C-S lyase [unclassified Paenibacillus]PRA07834.1 aminotransferase [Paenibacillus sp. MYb63]PRA51478.1 aminotransferase [Paenibacillus sp. MYb67]
MKYDFDEIIDRKNTNAMSTDGFKEYIFKASNDMTFPFKDDEFIRMWVADMEFATPPEIIQSVKDRLDKRTLGYTKVFDPDYYLSVVQWTQDHYDWSFQKEHLVTSPGIIPALYELIEYICKPDEKVLIVTPSYAYFKHAVDFNHLELVTSDLVNQQGYYTMDYDDIELKVRDEKVSLCIFCNPHNPTGRVWTPEELSKFGEICLENDVMIISDEIHCDLLRNDMVHTPLAKIFPNTNKIISCMAPSKTFNMAGMMLSNIIIPNDEVRALWKARHYSMENPLSIAATQAAYQHGDEWLRQLKTYLDENFIFTQQYLASHLPQAVFRIPEATYLAWVDISAYLPDEENMSLYFANNAGVLLEGGSMFVANADGYIRLNLACPRAILEEGLKRICEVLY